LLKIEYTYIHNLQKEYKYSLGEDVIRLTWNLILSAIILTAYQGKKFNFSQGALYALIATSLFSFATISDVLIIRQYDAISFAAIMCLFPSIALLFIYPRSVMALPQAIKKINKNLLFMVYFIR